MSVEELILDYLKQYKSGNLAQLIHYISTFAEEFNIEIEKIKLRLIKLSEERVIDYNTETNHFSLIDPSLIKKEEYVKTSFKWSTRIGFKIELCENISLIVNDLINYLNNKINNLGSIDIIKDKEDNLFLEFKTPEIRCHIRIFSGNIFEIQAYPLKKLQTSNPLLRYIQKLNESDEERVSKLPTSMGAYLLFSIVVSYFQEKYATSLIKITDIYNIRLE